MQARIDNPALTVPGALQALQKLGTAVKHADVPATTLYLIELRASQINGCSVCVDMHSRELKAAGEQNLRVFEAHRLERDLGQHPDRLGVVEMRFQILTQQGVGAIEVAGAEGVGGGFQRRIGDGGAGEFRVGHVRAADIAAQKQQIAEGAPGVGQVAIQADGLAVGCDGAFGLAQGPQHRAIFKLGPGGARVGFRQRLDDRPGAGHISQATPSRSQDQQDPGIVGCALQQGFGLATSRSRIGSQKDGGALDRGAEKCG